MSKILIIDDDATMTSLLRSLLEIEGYQAASVRDWNALLAEVERENPALVILDCVLPGMDGKQVAAQMRASSLVADTKIVMTSGLPCEEECIEAGANAFILKPYPPDELLSTIRALLAEDGNPSGES